MGKGGEGGGGGGGGSIAAEAVDLYNSGNCVVKCTWVVIIALHYRVTAVSGALKHCVS